MILKLFYAYHHYYKYKNVLHIPKKYLIYFENDSMSLATPILKKKQRKNEFVLKVCFEKN